MKKIYTKLDDNLKELERLYSDTNEMIRDIFYARGLPRRRCALVYFDGMSDKRLIADDVKRPLSALSAQFERKQFFRLETTSFSALKERILVPGCSSETDFQKLLDALNRGDCVLFISGSETALIVPAKKTPKRNVAEPQAKIVIRGPHDGFTENYRDNTALLRSKIKSEKLRIDTLTMGEYTATSVGVCYITDLADKKITDGIKEKLMSMEFKSVLESGYLQNELEAGLNELLPLSEATERSDEAAIALLQGRVVIIVENTPFVLIVPGLFKSMLTSGEDYNESRYKQKVFLALRLAALIVTLILPAVYIAVVQYNPEFLSVKLISFVIFSRKYIPFPAFAEILFVEFIFEAIIEAGIRLPKQIGSTVSIVGTIAIGQGLVEASLVNMIVVVIVAFTAVLVFVIPNYSMAVSVRILKFFFMSAAAAAGFFGIIMLLLGCLGKLCDSEYFGVEYFAGLVDGKTTPQNVKRK